MPFTLYFYLRSVELEDQSSLSQPGGNRSAKSLIKEPVADSTEAHSSVNIGNSSVVEESSFYYAFDEHHLPSETLDVKVVDLVDTDDWKSSGKETHSNGPSAEADDKMIHFIPPPYELQSNSQELESITSSTHNGSLEDNEASLDCTANVGVEDVEVSPHAGEVYGEKAVLATEVREFQSRLCCLSDERDKALAIRDEMSKIMGYSIVEADEVGLAVEMEKLEKEELARAVLAEQEAIMDKRDLLMDRGCVVDILQGEISVIFRDVWLLKEKFDARVPLSQSVSLSQTCYLLASSGSSQRSLSNSLNLNDDEAFEILEER
ncbi:hypothetical protein MLD38_031804 [Melastoma candidum]|uniref:Uncharacterized protein n=1 Tax=Melastoma candidum TaxID=119954 RepID=A0ACB9MQU1_9MYRT|nr:hypothetical protein MLD38_031804 [Melastoma candidum]